MNKPEEFLVKLKYPNRDPIERDIKCFLNELIPSGIIETHVNRDKGSSVHTITITTDDINRFVTIDSVFHSCFPHTYAHGVRTLTNLAAGPDIKDFVVTFSKMYLIREYQ